MSQLILDAHLDLSMNAMEWNRDLTRPLGEIRDREKGLKNKLKGATFYKLGRSKIFIVKYASTILKLQRSDIIIKNMSLRWSFFFCFIVIL